jgi:type I restriction enzyme M protein
MSGLNISNFIWNIADDVLRDIYVRGKYRDVILPMTVIRRLDAVLEPTKGAVLTMKRQLDEAGVANQHAALCQVSAEAFYNTSPFRLRDLAARARRQQLKADFEDYLDGFSQNVQEVLDKFKFRNQVPTLVEADALGFLLEKFLDPSINLSPKPVLLPDGNVRLPGLDNHSMGTIFEELIRRFNEENNEEAGEHFTPRDVVKLMAYLIFMPIASEIQSGTYLVYDGACGTGGMLTVAEETLVNLARDHGKEVSVHLYGQEVNPETFAISKADLILKGEGVEAENMKFGSTLSADAYPSGEFDFMLSNPPYGKSWKTDLERLGGKKEIRDPRFVIEHAGNPEYSLITRSNDGQMVFLANMLSKMKGLSPLGSRIAEVHNGASLFTGDAGSGESNVRRRIIENDWLETVIALPLNIFYNTGIATYIWVISNRKSPSRKGQIQLIDATMWFKPLRKNLGKKSCELGPDDIMRICDAFLTQEQGERSKIFPNDAFGYWKVIVERPLRLTVDLTDIALRRFRKVCADESEQSLIGPVDQVAQRFGAGPHRDFNTFVEAVEAACKASDVRMTAKRQKLLTASLGVKDPDGAPVIKTAARARTHADSELDALYGSYHLTVDGKAFMIEYEPDGDLRDTEQVSFVEEGGIEAFFRREVLPHAPDAWIDHTKTVVGYEVSFTRHFFKPRPLRALDEIEADIRTLEKETEGFLEDVLATGH